MTCCGKKMEIDGCTARCKDCGKVVDTYRKAQEDHREASYTAHLVSRGFK